MTKTQARRVVLVAACVTTLVAAPLSLAAESNEALMARLDRMQQEIEELKRQLAQTQDQSSETDAKVEAVAEAIESQPLVA
ncbi:MAG: hypothetical protein HKN58_08940, partial [Xanthomonadales bacterium]|nr:hypothetical protein [Xanthomonadales bacterium]